MLQSRLEVVKDGSNLNFKPFIVILLLKDIFAASDHQLLLSTEPTSLSES